MREPLGDAELPPVLRREHLADPPAEGRRAATQVDGDVEHLAPDDADELPLRVAAAGSGGRAARRASDRLWLSCTKSRGRPSAASSALG